MGTNKVKSMWKTEIIWDSEKQRDSFLKIYEEWLENQKRKKRRKIKINDFVIDLIARRPDRLMVKTVQQQDKLQLLYFHVGSGIHEIELKTIELLFSLLKKLKNNEGLDSSENEDFVKKIKEGLNTILKSSKNADDQLKKLNNKQKSYLKAMQKELMPEIKMIKDREMELRKKEIMEKAFNDDPELFPILVPDVDLDAPDVPDLFD